MPDLDTFCSAQLARIDASGRRRTLHAVERLPGGRIRVDGKEYLSFSCNDYLGLSHHPDVLHAAAEASALYGAGGGGARLVTGNHPLYASLEDRLARLKTAEAVRVFGSGYLANTGIIPALAGRGDLVLADRLAHACLLDGARLSGATLQRFRHNDTAHLEKLLKAHGATARHRLILTEVVFSMDGDWAPLADILALAERYDAWVLSDDAHGFPFDKLSGTPDTPAHPRHLRMGTLSKAAGVYGGYICGSEACMAWLDHTARTLMFATALPPAVVAAADAALRVIEEDLASGGERVRRPLTLAQRFTCALGMSHTGSAIVPVILGANAQAVATAERVRRQGFWVTAIRPPTVPEHTARLRITFSAAHREEDVDTLAQCIKGAE